MPAKDSSHPSSSTKPSESQEAVPKYITTKIMGYDHITNLSVIFHNPTSILLPNERFRMSHFDSRSDNGESRSVRANSNFGSLDWFQAENAGHNLSIFERVNEMTARKGCIPAQLALAWVHHQEAMCVPSPEPQRLRIQPEHRSPVSETHTGRNEDGISIGSLLGVVEKTIKAGCEQMKSSNRGDSLVGDATASGIYDTVRSEVRCAIFEIQNDLKSAIQRSDIPAIATTNIDDIAPNLVNPSTVELSEERTRRLRSDLAIKEHRGLELNRILKEVLPDPKSSNVPKSRTGRKVSSIERRKISKRLMEEAMDYFDECVSLSTFDSSDFSSPENPPLNIVGGTTAVGNGVFSFQESSGVSATDSSSSYFKDKQATIPCDLFTGQERDEVDGAKHMAVTVEMADVTSEYDCTVIDEGSRHALASGILCFLFLCCAFLC
ncbi:hypothetical protein UlMin_020496 [Ulmus minor]